MVEFSYPSLHTHSTCKVHVQTYTYIYMLYNLQRAAYILARCPTCLHSYPSIIIIIITITRKTPRELFDEREKICGTKVHVHDMYKRYRLYGAGYSYTHMYLPRYVQYMSIHRYLRIIGPVIIMRSTLTGTSTGYSTLYTTLQV